MSGNCPQALLEAQTILILACGSCRTKTFRPWFRSCNDDYCQRYRKGVGNLSTQAISATNNTRGKFLIFNDMVCDTRYSKSCGGVSEHNENVWDMEPKPYLQGVFDSEQKGLPDLSDPIHFKEWLKNDHGVLLQRALCK